MKKDSQSSIAALLVSVIVFTNQVKKVVTVGEKSSLGELNASTTLVTEEKGQQDSAEIQHGGQ